MLANYPSYNSDGASWPNMKVTFLQVISWKPRDVVVVMKMMQAPSVTLHRWQPAKGSTVWATTYAHLANSCSMPWRPIEMQGLDFNLGCHLAVK